MELVVPILNEIIVRGNEEINDLPSLLKNANAGSSPIIINIENLSKGDSISFLNLLYPLLKQINLHPEFPYPIFILSLVIKNHPNFIIISNKNNIPTHYKFEHNNKLLHREAELLRKVLLNNTKINNLYPYEKKEKLLKTFKSSRVFSDKILELSYYEEIISKLNKF